MTNQFSGGTTYTNGSESWRVFTATGPLDTSALEPTSLVMNPKSASIGSSLPGAVCDILVVAGGGGSGQGTYSGGGGAGGFVFHENLTVPSADHTITIGAGGGSRSPQGGNSNAFPGTPATITAIGGGYGVHDTESVLVVLVVLAVVHPSVQTTSTQTLVLVVDNNQSNLEFQVPLVGETVQTQHRHLVVTMVLLAVVLVVRTVHLMVFQNHSYQQVVVTSPQHS